MQHDRLAKTLALIGFLSFASALFADTLGFLEQRFSALSFEKNKWSRVAQPPCFTYTALEDGATVEVMRYGTSNLVPFKATKNLKVAVCGSTAALDEGFEAEVISLAKPGKAKPTASQP